MSQLWIQESDDGWKVLALGGDRFPLPGEPAGGGSPGGGRPEGPEPALVRALDAAGSEQWVLVTEIRSGVRVNGQRVPGVRILTDKDEIRVPQLGSLFYSTERQARVEPFAGAGDASCPRCLRPLEPDEPTVRCPGCGIVYHEMDEWHCWTHTERCQVCHQATRFDLGLQWTPESL